MEELPGACAKPGPMELMGCGGDRGRPAGRSVGKVNLTERQGAGRASLGRGPVNRSKKELEHSLDKGAWGPGGR